MISFMVFFAINTNNFYNTVLTLEIRFHLLNKILTNFTLKSLNVFIFFFCWIDFMLTGFYMTSKSLTLIFQK